MPKLVWYRSLYWRFAIGLVVLLALLLGAQGFVFLWMTGSMPELFPSRTSAQLANTIASDLAASLKEQPDLHLIDFVTKNHPTAFRAFVIAMKDCRMAPSQRIPITPQTMPLLFDARRRMGIGPNCESDGRFPGPGGPPPGAGDRPEGFGRGADPATGGRGPGRGADDFFRGGPTRGGGPRGGRGGPGRGGPPRLAADFAPVIVDGDEVGMVAVASDPPPLMVTLRDVGPTLAVVGLTLLVAGTAIASLVVFGPASRRLRDLQYAAIAVGAGITGARAPESGRDEVTSLAQAFNDMAAKLEERSSALEASNRTRRQLLADVSHELSTPLSAIRGYVETLAMPNLDIDHATRTRYLNIIREETVRLEHIIGDLLDLAKLEGGGAPFKMEPVAVTQLFERIQQRHQPVVQQKRIELQTVVSDPALTVHGDQKRLEQALQNLVANAVRHTPEGGRIVVEGDRLEGGVRLSVQDTGPGIPPEHLPRVFDRFYKVDVSRTGTALPSGSGLGLSIVQAIVNRHHGSVTALNPESGGARFEILLPEVNEHSSEKLNMKDMEESRL